MKIIEVRDGFIKFEADSNICLSSFVKADGTEKSYIAQVSRINTVGTVSIADAKILFIYKNDELMDYDKTEPPKDAEINCFTYSILTNSIRAKQPIIIGKTLDNTCNIFVDSKVFDKKMLISVDDKNIHNILTENFSKQFEHKNKKTVVIDTIGILSGKKIFAGVDFKLPLNSSSLSFMYESCLNDATSDSKNTIMDIFNDLAEYSQTVPFVPFGTLKSIVDDMVDKQHIFKLLVLKNKLAKFAKFGYFATSQQEVSALDNALNSQSLIIDLSKLDAVFQNCYLEYIYEILAKLSDIQVFLEVSNNISKKNLKMLISDSIVPTTLLTHSKFQYLNDIRTMFDNFIIEPSKTNNEIFKVYSSFLNSMQKNMYLTTGEAVNYIPIVSFAQIINEFEECNDSYAEEAVENEEVKEEDNTNNNEEKQEDDLITEEIDEEMDEETDEESEIDEIEYYSKPLSSQTKIIEAINSKSEEAINFVTKNLDYTENLELFEEDDEGNQVEEAEIEDTDGEEVIDAEEVDSSALNDIEENTLENLTDENSDEIDEADLTEVTEPVQEEVIAEEDIENFEEDDSDDISFEDNDIAEPSEEIDLASSDEEDISNEEDILEEDIINKNDEFPDLTEESIEDNIETESLNNISEPEEMSVEIDNEDALLIDAANDGSEIESLPNDDLNVDLDNVSENNVLPVSDDSVTSDFDEIIELDPTESNEDDIVVDLSDDNDTSEIDEKTEHEIIDDVDKVYTTIKENPDLEEISDSDLDFIDELNNSDEELEEYQEEELEEISDSDLINSGDINDESIQEYNDNSEILEKRDSSTPIVPVYDADIPQEDIVISDPIQQGDAVMHAKYGNGVVEKMIKYGNKTLFAINFENIGRRLLDPTLTEIKRV